MQKSNNIAIANARRLADITTLLAAAKSADEAREIFRARYPSAHEQALTPPEGAANEPEFWRRLIETAKEFEGRCLHLDFDAEFVLASAPKAEGRETLYEGALRDGSQGVIYVPQALEVYDDPELADLIWNNGSYRPGYGPDDSFVADSGRDPDEWRVEWREQTDANGDPIRMVLDTSVPLRLGDEREATVADIMRRIERELIGHDVGSIRSDLLLSSIQDRADSDCSIMLIDDAIEHFRSKPADDWFAIAASIDEEKVLNLTDPYFCAWIVENMTD